MGCLTTFAVKKASKTPPEEFTAGCDIVKNKQRAQMFTANQSGILKSFSITTLQSGYPDKGLTLSFYESLNGKIEENKPLSTSTIPRDSIGWSAKVIKVNPRISLIKGKQYMVVINSESSQGCYGFASGKITQNSSDFTLTSNDKGKTFIAEKDKKLKFSFVIQ